ncbi:MAG: alanine racemase [bacterium]|jgi:alanine racemase
MPRPIVATTDVTAMRSNLAVAQAAMPGTKIWAVIKADAYGHGLENGLHGFALADGLSLIEFDRAVKLRELGWTKPIMMMQGMFEPIDLDVISQYQLQPVVHNHEQLEILSKARLETPLHVHLKINSGMNRLGFLPEQTRDAYNRLAAMPAVGAISLITHFANADSRDVSPDVATQVATFKKHTADIQADISLSNSPAILMHPEVRGDWIRPGVMLYGGSPGGGDAASFGLKAAMTLSSRVIAVQSIRAGDSVGYGSLFRAERDMRIGIVACGYADGYPRQATTGAPVLVEGVRTRLLGRVSMDMLNVDLSSVPQAHVGSDVTLWGDNLPIDEVAAAAGTIGYELMCAITPRVQRNVRS